MAKAWILATLTVEGCDEADAIERLKEIKRHFDVLCPNGVNPDIVGYVARVDLLNVQPALVRD